MISGSKGDPLFFESAILNPLFINIQRTFVFPTQCVSLLLMLALLLNKAKYISLGIWMLVETLEHSSLSFNGSFSFWAVQLCLSDESLQKLFILYRLLRFQWLNRLRNDSAFQELVN